jgi:hypothetical protein
MTTTISGDTGVSAVQPGVVAQAALTAGVAGTGPAFKATLLSNKSVSAAWAVAAYDNKVFDTDNCYNASTNKFTPNVAGYYLITLLHYYSASGSLGQCIAGIAKNGVLETSQATVGSATSCYCSLSSIFYLNGTTDYIQGQTYSTAGTTPVLNTVATNITGTLIRRA